jgi:murein DD-endopeptidase MepM/ murein hydrolase activator NlpD
MSVFYRHPVDHVSISEGFGKNSWRTHWGVDYRPPTPGQTGVVVYAPAPMTIVWARGEQFAADNPWEQMPNNGNNGNSIIGRHPEPDWAMHSMYCHLAEIFVKEGQFVDTNEPLGIMGWTGYVLPADPNGMHLHFEAFIDYSDGEYPPGTFYGRVNPLDYFKTATTVPVQPGPQGSASTGVTDLLIPGLSGLSK